MSCDCWPTLPPFRRRLAWVCEHGNRWKVRAMNDALTEGPILWWTRDGRHEPPAASSRPNTP